MLSQPIPGLSDGLVQALAWGQAVVLGLRTRQLRLGIEHPSQEVGRQEPTLRADRLEVIRAVCHYADTALLATAFAFRSIHTLSSSSTGRSLSDAADVASVWRR